VSSAFRTRREREKGFLEEGLFLSNPFIDLSALGKSLSGSQGTLLFSLQRRPESLSPPEDRAAR
jgi:hypothetical protein